MGYSLEFKDYAGNPKELIGKWVNITNRYNNSVTKITGVTKTSFKVDGWGGLFNIKNGYLKGKDIWNTTSSKLISEEQAIKLKKEIRQRNESSKMRDCIKDMLPDLSYDALIEITNVIKSHQPT